MAGFIKGWWESIKVKVGRLLDGGQVIHDMKTGGCFDQYGLAMVICDRDSLKRSAFERDYGEAVYPIDHDACVKATETLRQCMQRSPDVFSEHLVAMENGIKVEERQRREEKERRRREEEDDPRFRWWTGLRNDSTQISKKRNDSTRR